MLATGQGLCKAMESAPQCPGRCDPFLPCLREAGVFSEPASETSLVGQRFGMTTRLFTSRQLPPAVAVQGGVLAAASS